MTEGYIVLACGGRKYAELALNLVLSLKLNDKRPVALLEDLDEGLPREYSDFFDVNKKLPESPYGGNTRKMDILASAPFDRNMYLDTDCLLVKRDISHIWKRLRGAAFGVMGSIGDPANRKTFKDWPAINLDLDNYLELLEREHLSYSVVMNEGVIYFEKGGQLDKVIGSAKEYFDKYKDYVTHGYRSESEYILEYFFGAAMAKCGLKPVPNAFRSGFRVRQWQALTRSAKDYDIDVMKGICSFAFGGAGHRESPTVAHFMGLDPFDIYLRESNKLREHFGVERLSKEVLR